MTNRTPRHQRPSSLDDQIAARLSSLRWSTAIVLTGFIVNAAIVVLIVSVISGSMIVSLIAVAVMALFVLGSALYVQDHINRAMKAAPLPLEKAPWLHSLVSDLAEDFGISPPEVYVAPSQDLQAWTTGLGNKTKVVFCAGLFDELSEDEIEAVAAHELAHIANRDMPLLVWTEAVTLWVTFISTLAAIASFALFGAGRGAASVKGEDWTAALAGWVIAALAFIVGALLFVTTRIWALISLLTRLAVSRQREYLADARAVAITGDPGAFSRALTKIASDPHLSRGATIGGSFCVVSPAATNSGQSVDIWVQNGSLCAVLIHNPVRNGVDNMWTNLI